MDKVASTKIWYGFKEELSPNAASLLGATSCHAMNNMTMGQDQPATRESCSFNTLCQLIKFVNV